MVFAVTPTLDMSAALTDLTNFISTNAATLAGLLGLGLIVKWGSKLPRRFAR